MVVPPIRSPAVRLDVVARPGQERAEAGHDQARPRYFASKLPVHGNGFCSDECHLSLTVVLFMSKIVAQHAEGIHHSWNFGACSLGLSATSQQYFSLRTNQPPATSQPYSSLITNQH
jgi:hypothetical protein